MTIRESQRVRIWCSWVADTSQVVRRSTPNGWTLNDEKRTVSNSSSFLLACFAIERAPLRLHDSNDLSFAARGALLLGSIVDSMFILVTAFAMRFNPH